MKDPVGVGRFYMSFLEHVIHCYSSFVIFLAGLEYYKGIFKIIEIYLYSELK